MSSYLKKYFFSKLWNHRLSFCHNMPWKKMKVFLFDLVKTKWHYSPWCRCLYIHCDVHGCKLHMQEIHYCTHPSRIEPKTSQKHIKVLTTNTLQNFVEKEKKVEPYCVLTWNCLVNSNFNICFLFQMLQMKTWSWSLFNNAF